jgi:hypothetical protein
LTFELTGADGNQTIDAQVMDMAGNPSEEASSSIFLDTVMPSGILITINGGATYTNVSSVALAIAAEDPAPASGLKEMALGNDGVNWGPWETFSRARAYSLSAGDGKKTVYLSVRDLAGNIGVSGNATIILDPTPPTCQVSQLPTKMDGLNFTVSWSGSDATSGLSAYDIQSRKDAGDWTDWMVNTTATSSMFTGQDGHNYSFRIRALDIAGNRGAYPTTASASTRIDIPVPEVTIDRPAADSTMSGKYTIKGTAIHPKAGMNVILVRIQLDNKTWRTASGTGNWSYVLDSMTLSNGRHTLKVSAFDGTKYSRDATVEFNVDNKVTVSDNMMLWVVLIVVIAVVVVGAVFLAKRRKGAP